MAETLKTSFVSDLAEDAVITSVFLVQSKDLRQKRDGEPYLSLVLSDRSGQIEAKMWDQAAAVQHSFE
ncbi:MAG: DNA-binding protein, partial [Terriglobales bacterium]